MCVSMIWIQIQYKNVRPICIRSFFPTHKFPIYFPALTLKYILCPVRSPVHWISSMCCLHLSNVIHKNTLFSQINPLFSSLYLLTHKKTERASHQLWSSLLSSLIIQLKKLQPKTRHIVMIMMMCLSCWWTEREKRVNIIYVML